MKRKLFFVSTLLLLVLSDLHLFAQKKPVVRLANGSSASTRKAPVRVLANKVNSCGSSTITLTTQAQINSFSADYPGCTELYQLIIDGTGSSPITSLAGLSGIAIINDNLIIQNTGITNLSQMTGLLRVKDTLLLRNDTLLTAVGLNNLDTLGNIYFKNVPLLTTLAGISNHITTMNKVFIDTAAITSLNGLQNITELTSDLEIRSTSLVNLNSVNNLTKVQYLWLENNPQLTSIALYNLVGLAGVVAWNDTLMSQIGPLSHGLPNPNIGSVFFYNTAITDLSGLDSLQSIPNTFIGGNRYLTSLHGLEKMEHIDYGVTIWFNTALTDVTALSGLNAVANDKLEITGNASLSDLTGLGNITDIGGGLIVIYNGLLDSLGKLNRNLVIHANNGNPDVDTVQIFDNYNLSVCAYPPICNFLASGRSAEIHDNAPGCNDEAEVRSACNILAACTLSYVTWNGNVSDEWNDTLNWTPNIVPGPCTVVTIPNSGTLSNQPYTGFNISIGGLIMENGSDLNMGGGDVHVKNILHLDGGNINNPGSVVADAIYQPFVHSSYIGGNFTCQDYGGLSEFLFNTFDGNVILSDSIGRTESSSTFFNNFNGNLTFVNNSDYGQMYLSNASPSHDYVDGNLSVINNSTADISVGLGGGEPLQVKGDFSVQANDGRVDINTITFINDGYAHIKQMGSLPIVITTLYQRKYGWSVILDSSVVITQKLEFGSFSGGIVTTATKLLTLRNNAIAVQGYSGGVVLGPLKKIGNQPFTFPIGKIEQNTFWKAPLTITTPALPTDEFTAEYFHHDASIDGYDTASYAPGFGGVQGKEYWNLDRTVGSSKVKITLPYDSFRSGTAYLYQYMQMASWNGSRWNSLGNGGFAGAIFGGTLLSADSVSTFGPLTLSFKPIRIPVITIGTVDPIPCLGYYFKVPFTLDTPLVNPTTFTVKLSDTLGNFAPYSFYQFGQKVTKTSDTILAYINTNFVPNKNYKIRVTADLPPDTSINIVNIFPGRAPSLPFTIIGPSPACIGVQKYYISSHEAGATYAWSLQGTGTFTVNGDTATVTWTAVNSNYLVVYSSNSCGNGVGASLYVPTRPPAPSVAPVINNTGRTLYSSQAPGGSTYQWYRNGVAMPGETNSSVYVPLTGNYTMIFSNSCGSSPVSNTISFAADALAQTINFPAISDRVFDDPPFTPTATATSGLPVTFTIVSGPAYINAQTGAIMTSGVGLVTVAANQSGNTVYGIAPTVTRTYTINKAPQTITIVPVADRDFRDGDFILYATSSSMLFVYRDLVSGPATLVGEHLTPTGTGTIIVKASQPGNIYYFPAADVYDTFCVRAGNLAPINGFTNLCPATATYSVNNVPGATYFWRIAGGSSLPSTTNTVNINWTTPGVYTLLASATGLCGPGSNTDTLSVNVINSIQPDSVQAMFPADGVINQQLPLTLSWVPAQPAGFYTFDVYIWPADSAQTATPFASNINSVNYTVPRNSLVYNRTYKWMVVSHNGSCTIIHTGPVQKFSLIPLPDLIVQNVQAPTTAFSGQTIAINWTVRNAGPGKTTTDQSWTDAVFLSFDTMPVFSKPPAFNPGLWNFIDLPVKPLLIATKANLTALDSNQQYTNSVNFTLPLNYSQPLYVYVIANYPAGGNAPVQVTTINDTARAPQPVAVTLSPTPDLRVDTVFTPSTTFSGSTINLTYKVKNYGVLTPAGSSWADKVYISQSPLFNINTAIPLKYPKFNGTYYANAQDVVLGNATQLQADSAYTQSAQVVIPNYIFGSWFIYVVTNSGATLYEGALSNNNVGRNELQVFLTPTPHLTVSSLSVPVTTASTTQPIGVNWNISNTGFNDNIEKNKGHYAVPFGTCSIPGACGVGTDGLIHCAPPTPGQSIRDSASFGSSFWIDKVYLSKDGGGLNTGTAILVTQSNQGFENSGLYASENLFNSFCSPYGNGYSQSNANIDNVIKPGSNHPKAGNFVIPASLPAGDYYVYVLANSTKTVFEYPGTPETRRSALPISIQRPDIIVPSVTVPPTSIGGTPVAINYYVVNNGPGTVFNSYRNDRVYVSASPVFDGSAQLIQTLTFLEDMPVGAPIAHTLNYTFPIATTGTRYFYVHTNYDSSFRESNQNNNISAAVSTVVSAGAPADLIVSSITIADTVYSFRPTFIKYTVPNNGTGATAGAWVDSIFISCVPTFSPATSYFAGLRGESRVVAPGSSYSDSFNLSLVFGFNYNGCFPESIINTAYFFVKTNANNGTYEGANTNNNVAATGSRVFINLLVDHIVTNVTGADVATVGRPYTTGWTVKNIGLYPNSLAVYNNWYDAIYFSPDSMFNANAVIANNYLEAIPLNTNQTYTESRAVIPPVLPTGDYYVFAKTNFLGVHIPAEKILTNNTNLIRDGVGTAKKIHLVQPLLPDLVDSIILSPALAPVGQPLIVKYKITNTGAGPTYPDNWNNRVWLSTDFIPGNTGDILLSSKNQPTALAPGDSFTDSINATLALNILPGNYVLISQANAIGNVLETNMNNNLGFKYLTVYTPAPSDLLVESISKPDTAFLGYTVDTSKWVVRNASANAAIGYTSDGIYLSKSTMLDSTAVLIGIRNKLINMAPLARDTITLAPLVTNVTEGNYNVIVKTDLLNNIVETNKDNNSSTAATQLYVGVKELKLNVLTPNTLTSVGRFYKLIVPDSLSGSTLQVVLKSNDSLLYKNQLFIGKGYVPSAANFDYTYSTPNYGNQDIVITSVTAGVYYITAKCASINAPSQIISLKAVKLPFSILNVQSSSGGNIGNVTIKITGSLFSNNMTAKLTKAGTTIDASAIYFVNSTIVYATFNLQGKPLGLYDVTLTKPDTTSAALANGFSIVNANNGGLITGGGINTGSGDGQQPGCDPGAASGLNSQLVTELVMQDQVLGGWIFVIQVNYNNPTNVDIPAQVRILYSEKNIKMALTPEGVAGSNGSTALYLELTEQNGPPGIIRAGGSGTILVYTKAPLTIPGHTKVYFSLK
ncbi:MAG: hypothetical protein ABIX01_00385 [Chitinophagaceae bacterium]